MVIELIAGRVHVAPAGKNYITRSMFDKGRSFVGGGLLVRRSGGNEYVALHLICQGLEAILKAVLLSADYAEWAPKIKRMPIRHDLIALATAASVAAGLPAPRGACLAELVGLNDLYRFHRMRFGTVSDLFIDPRTIPSGLVVRRTAAAIRLVERIGL